VALVSQDAVAVQIGSAATVDLLARGPGRYLAVSRSPSAGAVNLFRANQLRTTPRAQEAYNQPFRLAPTTPTAMMCLLSCSPRLA